MEINLEEGENNAEGLNDDADGDVFDQAEIGSGYAPTTPPTSDQGSDREQPAKRPRDVAEEKLAPGPPDRRIRMNRMEMIRMIQIDGIFLSLKGSCFFNMRVGATSHMTADATHVCRHVVELLLDVLKRKVMVIREQLFS